MGDVAPELIVPPGAMTWAAPTRRRLTILRGSRGVVGDQRFRRWPGRRGHRRSRGFTRGYWGPTRCWHGRAVARAPDRRRGTGCPGQSAKSRQDSLRYARAWTANRSPAPKSQLAGIAVVAGQTLVAEPQASSPPERRLIRGRRAGVSTTSRATSCSATIFLLQRRPRATGLVQL